MKLNRRQDILKRRGAQNHAWFKNICREIEEAISLIVWPPRSKSFTINPTRKGNGVVPIKSAFIKCLKKTHRWDVEVPLAISSSVSEAGPIDAVRKVSETGKLFAVEWETGNISSTHRALNKMALGIIKGQLAGGALILPSKKLYRWLTDRIGNFDEIEPYFPVWDKLDIPTECIISVFEIEYDFESRSAALIPKGKDGMARGLISSRSKTQQYKKIKSPRKLIK